MPQQPALIEIYEDRIARLEEGVTDCKVDLGIVKTQIFEGVKMLSEKLDMVANLSERLSALETREQIYKEVKVQEEKSLVKQHDRRTHRLKVLAAVGSGIVAFIGLVLKLVLGQ